MVYDVRNGGGMAFWSDVSSRFLAGMSDCVCSFDIARANVLVILV